MRANKLVQKITAAATSFKFAKILEKDNVITIKNDKGYILIDSNKGRVHYKGPTDDFFWIKRNAEDLNYGFVRDL